MQTNNLTLRRLRKSAMDWRLPWATYLIPDQAVQQKQNKTGRSDPAEQERWLSSEETLLLLREPAFGSQKHTSHGFMANFQFQDCSSLHINIQ